MSQRTYVQVTVVDDDTGKVEEQFVRDAVYVWDVREAFDEIMKQVFPNEN
jgi:hypothetical protein